MQIQIYDAIIALSKDVALKMPNWLEESYYEKMCYSGYNKKDEVDNEKIKKTISFEVAFVHIVVYFFAKLYRLDDENYTKFLKKLDTNNVFDWYEIEQVFIIEKLNNLKINQYNDIIDIIVLHDTFIDKDVKKILGQFYTPDEIVEKMINDIKNPIMKLEKNDLIIDPACGMGIFLIKFIKKLSNKFKEDELITYVIDNVYGYDINPFAIIMTKISILYTIFECVESKGFEKNKLVTSNEILPNIKCKNTISENDKNKYSIILGNPPYFKLTKELIRDLTGYEEVSYGQPNIYTFFMYWAIMHLKDNGSLTFIIPQSIRSGLYFKNIRAIINKLQIKSIIHIDSRVRIFDRAEQAVLILRLENKPKRNTKAKIEFYEKESGLFSSFKIDSNKIMLGVQDECNLILCKNAEMYKILEKVYENSFTLDSQESDYKFSNGLYVWNQHKEDLTEDIKNGIPIIYGGYVQPLNFDITNIGKQRSDKKKYAMVTDKTRNHIMTGKKLLMQRTTNFEHDIRLKACLISEEFLEKNNEYFLENHVNFLCNKQNKHLELEDEILYFYLTLLNSKIVNYIFSSKSGNTQVSSSELNSLPIPHGGHVDIIRFIDDNKEDLHNQMDVLDVMICRAYGLTEDETNYILNY